MMDKVELKEVLIIFGLSGLFLFVLISSLEYIYTGIINVENNIFTISIAIGFWLLAVIIYNIIQSNMSYDEE